MLAYAAQLHTDGVINASHAWRTHVGGQSNSERLVVAKTLFEKRNEEDAKVALALLRSSAGYLAVQRSSEICQAGVAHITREGLHPTVPVVCLPDEQRNNMLVLGDYVYSQELPPRHGPYT